MLAGNALAVDGHPLDRMNLADPELVNPTCLGSRLAGMASGDPLAELPSCNLVLRPRLGFRYAPVRSAEDHWLTTRVLEAVGRGVVIDEDLVYCTYSLSGAITRENRSVRRHRAARVDLFEAWKRSWRADAS